MWNLIVHEARWGVTVGCGDLAEVKAYKSTHGSKEELFSFLQHLGFQIESSRVQILNPGAEPVGWLIDHDPDAEDANGFILTLER